MRTGVPKDAQAIAKEGVHPKIVQELLGHASIQLTLDTYSHYLPDMQEKAVDAMQSALQDSFTTWESGDGSS